MFKRVHGGGGKKGEVREGIPRRDWRGMGRERGSGGGGHIRRSGKERKGKGNHNMGRKMRGSKKGRGRDIEDGGGWNWK